MKYYLIAGEASGDLHGANLIKQLRLMDKDAQFRAWGGDKMASEGATLVKHYKEMSFMGFFEVFVHLFKIFANMRLCKKDIYAFYPDVLILIDYPGFNLRMAAFAKSLGIKTVYYISPKIWAWNTGRVHKIKKVVDFMLCILPFEKAFYQKYNFSDAVHYVGNPLVDAVEEFKSKSFEKSAFLKENNLQADKPVVALLPGSRTQEVQKILPTMLKTTKFFPETQFAVAMAPGKNIDFYAKWVKKYPNIVWVQDDTYKLLRVSQAALVKSGTSTLETALFEVPQVVCYKTGWISYILALLLVKVPYISLVNLIAQKPLVKELIQFRCHSGALKTQLQYLLSAEGKIYFEGAYQELFAILGEVGASHKAARVIFFEAMKKNYAQA